MQSNSPGIWKGLQRKALEVVRGGLTLPECPRPSSRVHRQKHAHDRGNGCPQISIDNSDEKYMEGQGGPEEGSMRAHSARMPLVSSKKLEASNAHKRAPVDVSWMARARRWKPSLARQVVATFVSSLDQSAQERYSCCCWLNRNSSGRPARVSLIFRLRTSTMQGVFAAGSNTTIILSDSACSNGW